jgi:hypothetical protein
VAAAKKATNVVLVVGTQQYLSNLLLQKSMPKNDLGMLKTKKLRHSHHDILALENYGLVG